MSSGLPADPAAERSTLQDESEAHADAIARQAGRGLRWSLLGTMFTKVGSFAMGLVLARLLSPADFVDFAVALAALNLLMNIKDLGLIAATVQWRGKPEEMAPTAASLGVAFGFLAYGLFWWGAPTFAGLAGNSEAAPIVRLLTLIILIEGFTLVRTAALMRGFRQDRLIAANLLGLITNAITSITLAANGAGAFSFAWASDGNCRDCVKA